MHRLNLTIDETLYEKVRAVSFIEKKSISQMIRESLSEYIEKNSKTKEKASLILEADDEKEILSILANDEFISNDEFKNKFNLWLFHTLNHLKKKFSKYDRKLQEKIFQAIQNIPEGDIKRLTGDDIPPIYRIRVSKYRILFHMNEEEVQILKVDSRGDIYK